MNLKSRVRLLLLEFEEYWDFPILEIVLLATMFALLNSPIADLHLSLRMYIPVFLIMIVGVIIPRSFAGSLRNREIVVLLSYPLKRWSIFLSKFLVNYLMLSAIFSFVVFLDVPLLGLSPLNPEIYVAILILCIQLLFLCAVATAISLTVKNEVISVFVFILLFFGLEFSLVAFEPPYKYLTLAEGSNVIFTYLTDLITRASRPPFLSPPSSKFTFQDFTLAFASPLLTSAILLIAAFIYFQWIMQID